MKGYFTSARIAYLGVMTALVFGLLTLETYVFTPILGLPAAVLTIPFAIALCLAGEKSDMLVGGTILGVCSFVLSFIVGLVPFMNPLISVAPRICIGLTAGGIFYLAKASKNRAICYILSGGLVGLCIYFCYAVYNILGLSIGFFVASCIVIALCVYLVIVIMTKLSHILERTTFSYVLAGITGIITNTVLVLTMLIVFFSNDYSLTVLLSTIVSVNTVFELLGAIVLVPLIAPFVKKLKSKTILKGRSIDN